MLRARVPLGVSASMAGLLGALMVGLTGCGSTAGPSGGPNPGNTGAVPSVPSTMTPGPGATNPGPGQGQVPVPTPVTPQMPKAYSCANPGVPSAARMPLRRLTRAQYNNSVNDLLGLNLTLAPQLAEDEKVGLFDSNLLAPVTDLHVERLMVAAETAADAAVAELPKVLPCDPAVVGEDACAATLVDTLGARAFKRPLTAEERADYLGLYTEQRMAGEPFAEGVRQVLRAVLQAPQFVYLVEQAAPAGVAPLTGHEAAARLSYFLWNSLPDAELTTAASAGELTSEALKAQARRMVQVERFGEVLGSFHAQWLQVERLVRTKKDPTAFPQYTPELEAALLAEPLAFADSVIRRGDGSLLSLLTTNSFAVHATVLPLYGSSTPGQGGMVSLDATQRSGLLTLASTLAAHAHYKDTSPVLTGAFVRAHIMCQTPPPPPPNVMTDVPPAQPGETTRQRFDRHRGDPVCANCHELMDPIGYGFSNYDALGQYQATEQGQPIDASGRIAQSFDVDGPFSGVVELNQKLASSEQVRACVLGHWFQFALGRNLDSQADGCSVVASQESFAASGYNLRELVIAIAGSDAMRLQGPGGAP